MKKFLITIGALALFFSIFVLLKGWDDTKLSLTRYWGFFTVQNNPLLEKYDQDLKDVKNVAKEPRINLDELLSGGPPKDGIPSIDNPQFVSAAETNFSDEEIVVGVYLNDEARAYPYGILNWHEIVNDKIGDTPISVTLCPLCDTIPVFIREVSGSETTFGVSGKLYQSCLVMYDRLTDTLWSQPWGIGVAGEHVHASLERVPAHKTTLGAWVKKYPETKILSEETGHSRDYFRYPYGTYYTNDDLIFPARNQAKLEVHPKEIEAYLWEADDKTPLDHFSGISYHQTFKNLKEMDGETFTFGEREIMVQWDLELDSPRFFDGETEIPYSSVFGFVYPAFFE